MKRICRWVIVGIAMGFVLVQVIIAQRAEWKGKIETENGIKVVKNPKDPLCGEIKFELQEDLSIGNENDDNYFFPKGVWRLNEDNDGYIYVADVGNCRVQKYDRTGKYVQTIGRKGQGPGEYQFPDKIRFDNEGNLHVFEGRTIHVFNKDGTFKKRIILKAPLGDFFLSPQGSIFGPIRSPLEPSGPKESVVKLDPEGGSVQTVAEFRGELTKSRNAVVWHQYSSQLHFSPANTTTFCYGFSMEYKIFISDGVGKTTLIIEKTENPQSISGKERDWIEKKGPYIFYYRTQDAKPREQMVFPEHRPYFGGIMADDGGRIYVMRLKSVFDESPELTFGVFLKDGYHIYKMKLPFKPALIKAGFVYEIREDKETGNFKIIRYKIKNWDQIREGI